MVKKVLVLVLLFSVMGINSGFTNLPNYKLETNHNPGFDSYAKSFYQSLNEPLLSYTAFSHALKGFLKLEEENIIDNKEYLTVIDMTKSSKEKRFFVIHIPSKTLAHSSVVAHGKNTGVEYANRFSNIPNSHQSSIGFYKTAETYHGKHGLSLRLDGLEFSNNNARKRAIVVHSAEYASTQFITNYGRLGRSFGCPSLPKENYKEVVHKIKNGSTFFIYYPKDSYLEQSKYINHIAKVIPGRFKTQS